VLAAINISGIGSAAFTQNTRIFSNQSNQVAGFSRDTNGNGLNGNDILNIDSPTFATWDLTTPVGPVFDATPTPVNQATNLSTSLGTLSFTAISRSLMQSVAHIGVWHLVFNGVQLETYAFTPGYQYDIIRRRRGYLGVVAQLDLFYIKGSITASAQTLNGIPHSAQASSSTIRAPLPVAGPEFRYYLLPGSRRLFVAGNVLGMYFFGYGNFISSYGTVGVALNRHLNFQGGYQLASRLDIKAKDNRIGLNLSQSGAVAGLEISF